MGSGSSNLQGLSRIIIAGQIEFLTCLVIKFFQEFAVSQGILFIAKTLI
jgi:hypothetical protein